MSSLYDAALARVRRLASPKHYQVYDLCVAKGWPVRKVSKFLGINAAMIYVFKYRIERRIKKELVRLLAEAEPFLNPPPNSTSAQVNSPSLK
jgi:RNA polymerase sigma-70 factor (ECF subfamily)